MAWLLLSVEVKGASVEQTIAAFERIGSQATSQINAGEDSYYDLAHPSEPNWKQQCITGLFEDCGDSNKILKLLKAEAPFLKDIDITEMADKDWETAWLDQYQPIEINPNLFVYPSWVESDDIVETIIRIDPGMAFGTGTHATTRLCMQVLSELDLNDLAVLDYGCGSGILGITALKLGARSAVGVDIDPKAEQVAQQNARINGVEGAFAIQSDEEIDGQQFDLIVANILAYALIDLAPRLMSLLSDKAHIVLSGILHDQADATVQAYQSKFEFETIQDGAWLVLLGRRINPKIL